MEEATLCEQGPDRPSEYFGDLAASVALASPVSLPRLRRLLDRLGVDPPPDATQFAETSGGDVFVLSTAAWNEHATRHDLTPAEELAVRAVHGRMAEALGTRRLPPRSDPFVRPP